MIQFLKIFFKLQRKEIIIEEMYTQHVLKVRLKIFKKEKFKDQITYNINSMIKQEIKLQRLNLKKYLVKCKNKTFKIRFFII